MAQRKLADTEADLKQAKDEAAQASKEAEQAKMDAQKAGESRAQAENKQNPDRDLLCLMCTRTRARNH
jgi:hypothetical protein